MMDEMFDVSRANGEYPPKGWGWQSETYRHEKVRELIAAGDRRPWVVREAKRFGIEIGA